MNPSKILIIKTGSLGPILMTTPVIRALKQRWPESTLEFTTTQGGQVLLESNPNLSQIHLVDDIVKTFSGKSFDLIVDLENDSQTRKISKQYGKRFVSVDKLKWQQSLLVNFKINLLPNKHLVDRFFDTVIPFGVEKDDLGLDYFIPEKDEVENDWLPEAHRDEYIVFAIGAQYHTQQMTLEKLIETCDRINKPVILVGGKEDEKMGAQISDFFEKRANNETYEKGLKELNKKTILFNSCGKFGFHQIASVIKNARAVFTHDNHWMHVAAAFQKELYTIWGNTMPEMGGYPFHAKFTTFENNKLGCRPCTNEGYGVCPIGHFKCMKNQSLDFYIS